MTHHRPTKRNYGFVTCTPDPLLCPEDGITHQCLATAPSGWTTSTNAEHYCPDAGNTCFELPLPPPQNIRKIEATPDSITIAWDPVPTTQRYEVFRYADLASCTANTNGSSVGDNITATRIVDTGAGDADPDQETYHYRVRTVNARGTGTLSNDCQTHAFDNEALGTPANLQTDGTEAANTTFRMSWDSVRHALMYDMRRYSDANCQTEAWNFDDTPQAYADVEAAHNESGDVYRPNPHDLLRAQIHIDTTRHYSLK